MKENNDMFILTSGKRYKTVGIMGKDGKPEQIGTAEYNINDVNVRARIVEYARNVGELLREYENKSKEIHKKLKETEESLEKIEKRTKINGKEIFDNIQNKTSNYSDLDNIQKEVYEVYKKYINEFDEDGLPKNIDELIKLDIETTDKSIELFDKIFQEGFSRQAIGDEKNPFLLPELLELIADEYGVKYEYEKGKYVNREQRRAGNKK